MKSGKIADHATDAKTVGKRQRSSGMYGECVKAFVVVCMYVCIYMYICICGRTCMKRHVLLWQERARS